ncbi:MAG: hypothetical protein H6839_09600 [Planctomycetes bacterium]|nr:hypothetical protein [Planctomycetota bacterium]
MNEATDEKQKEKDEALQRRKEELEEELDRYAQAGAFSPGLIKATRWISRALYLAMAVGFTVMLFQGWGQVSKAKYDEAVQRAIDIKKTADEAKSRLNEAENGKTIAETKATLLENELESLKQEKGGRQAANDAIQRAAILSDALGEALTASALETAYREAGDGQGLDLLALYARRAEADGAGLMKMVATSERSLAEKIIAVRWMGERKDAGSRNLLQTLSEGEGVLAEEAKAALKQLGE